MQLVFKLKKNLVSIFNGDIVKFKKKYFFLFSEINYIYYSITYT